MSFEHSLGLLREPPSFMALWCNCSLSVAAKKHVRHDLQVESWESTIFHLPHTLYPRHSTIGAGPLHKDGLMSTRVGFGTCCQVSVCHRVLRCLELDWCVVWDSPEGVLSDLSDLVFLARRISFSLPCTTHQRVWFYWRSSQNFSV